MYSQDYYTTKNTKCQALKKLEIKKRQHDYLKDFYLKAFEISNKAAKTSIANFSKCGDYVSIKDNKINAAFFCRQRYCPICQWRLSLKVYHEITTIINALNDKQDYQYILMTLTVQNMDRLAEGITSVLKGFERLCKRRSVKKAFKGYLRTLEITRSEKGQWHPHIHCIWVVDSTYWDTAYIKQQDLIHIWQECVTTEYAPNVDIRMIKGDIYKAVAEVAKYAVKPFDLEQELNKAEILAELIQATYKRRLRAMGGVFKDKARELNITLEDDEQYSPFDNDASYVYYNGEYIADDIWREIMQQKENVTRQTLAKGVS